MRYPVGGGSREEFLRDWYIADGFGSYRVLGNYYHSGCDINLRSGGDSDLGQPIHAIANGRLVYYHKGSHPTRGYGIHNVYRIEGVFGVRWIHSAHCQSEDFVGQVTDLAEGDLTGRIGKSGTIWAHLHFSVFRVDPSTLPSGIDSVAKTPEQLDNIWEDPIQFINKYYGDNMGDEYGNMVWKSTQHDDTVKYLFGTDADPRATSSEDIQKVIAGYKSQATMLRQDLAKSEAEIKNLEEQVGRLKVQIAEMSALNKDLNTKLNEATEIMLSMREDYEARIKVLQSQIDALAKQKGELNKEIAVLESDLKECRAGIVTLSWHEHLLLAIKKLVRIV